MEIFIESWLTASVKIDRRLQQEESRALWNQMCTYRTCAGFQVSYLHGKMRSWEAWCFWYKLILVLVSNQLTVPVKIDGRQEQEETSALLKTGDQCTHVGHVRDLIQVQYLQETNAKLGGVVLYKDTHYNCNVQSVNCTCEN